MILCLCPNPSIDKFIWVDDFRPGKVNRIKKEQSFPGGKGIHVALGIAELGEKCALLGFWGGDTGKLIKEYCEERGISCYGPEIDKPNRTCFTFRSGGLLDGTELLEPGPHVSEEEINIFRSEYIRLLDTSSVICMSGSWPSSDTEIEYAGFIVSAKERGAKTFVDCSDKNLLRALEANPYCVHINNQEGFEVYNEHSPLKIAGAVLENSDLAAISCGADGLYLSGKCQPAIHASCRVDDIISTVGCGDSLMAGLVVAHQRNLGLPEMAKLGVACGAANCIREELGIFYKKDTDKLYLQAKLSFIEPELTF